MKKGNAFIKTGLLLIAAALIFTGYNLWDSRRAGKASDDLMRQIGPMINTDPVPVHGRIAVSGENGWEYHPGEIEYPDYILNPNMDMPVVQIEGKEYIGIVSIPSIERTMTVCSSWSYKNLKKSACRYEGSAYLDNMVICAHNYNKHFGPLRHLRYNDTVTFTDIDGNVFNYKVVEIETLPPSGVEQMTSGDWDLTLFTCTLDLTGRLAVRCERVEEEL